MKRLRVVFILVNCCLLSRPPLPQLRRLREPRRPLEERQVSVSSRSREPCTSTSAVSPPRVVRPRRARSPRSTARTPRSRRGGPTRKTRTPCLRPIARPRGCRRGRTRRTRRSTRGDPSRSHLRVPAVNKVPLGSEVPRRTARTRRSTRGILQAEGNSNTPTPSAFLGPKTILPLSRPRLTEFIALGMVG